MTAQARSWDELQEIAEAKYLGKTRIKNLYLDSPITEITLSRIDNPINAGTYLAIRAIKRGDDDMVEIHLVSRLGRSRVNCYFIAHNSNPREGVEAERSWLYKCEMLQTTE